MSFDINDFIYKGYSEITLSEDVYLSARNEISNEDWVPVEMETSQFGDYAKVYGQRFVASRSLARTGEAAEAYQRVADEIAGKLSDLFDQYPGFVIERNSRSITPFLGKSGYFMEPHSDEGDRSALIAVVYLMDDPLPENAGGQLCFYRGELDQNLKPVHLDKIGEVRPSKGNVALFNPSNPSILHEVRPLTDNSIERPSLFIAFGVKPD